MLRFKDLMERLNVAKAKMGDVIKDFQDSDAPQFKGKSAEKRRQMAIAAKLEADRGVKEEVEQIDELSSDTLKNYREKAKKQGVGIQNKMKIGGGDWSKDGQDTNTLRKRRSGHNTAGKILRKRGETHVHAEELELEEGRMKELSMDMETMGDKEFKAKHKKSKGDMQKSLKSEELKGSQHKIDANKNGKIDGHDFKILRNAKKARYQ